MHGTHVRVLGWGPTTKQKSFVSRKSSDFSAFGNTVVAQDLAANVIHAGADVVFAVDGPLGEVATCRAAQRSPHVLLIGVDTDQHYATPDCEAQWLTSVQKNDGPMVFLAMKRIIDHQFNGGRLEGTLGNGGVGLAPFYNLRSKVPLGLRHELHQAKQGVLNRSIPVDPRVYLSG